MPTMIITQTMTESNVDDDMSVRSEIEKECDRIEETMDVDDDMSVRSEGEAESAGWGKQFCRKLLQCLSFEVKGLSK
jgi:hypothetical protein